MTDLNYLAGSPALLRRLNEAAILRLLRVAGPLTRPDIARETRLSRPTVNDVVEGLLAAGYVDQERPDSEQVARRPGPRARVVRFRTEMAHVVGIDIGANKILVNVADLSGEVYASERRSTGEMSVDERLEQVRTTLQAALSTAGLRPSEVSAASVGTPGVVDPETGEVSLAPQLRGWEGLRLGTRLQQFLGCPTYVDNEVHLAVLAERWQGAAQGVENAVYVHAGVGIGAGIVIGGELHRGFDGAAGEVGYLPIGEAPDGSGTDRGRFELAAGGAAFARLGAAAARRPEGHILRELAGGDADRVDAETVFAAAATDASAAAIVKQLVATLADGVACLVVTVNPQIVVVGGGLSRAGDALLAPLRERIAAIVPRPPAVVLSALGDEAVAIGAVRRAVESIESRIFSGEGIKP